MDAAVGGEGTVHVGVGGGGGWENYHQNTNTIQIL